MVISLLFSPVCHADFIKEAKKAGRKFEKLINPHRGSNRNNSTGQKQAPSYYPMDGIDIKVTSCERWGDGAMIGFTLTNNTGEDKKLMFPYTGDVVDGTPPEPVIIDEAGNVHDGGPIKLGGDQYIGILGFLESKVPAGITVKGVFTVKGVSSNCNRLKKVTIGCVDVSNRSPFEYTFLDIPISTKANTNSENVTCSLPTMFVTYKSLERDGNDLILTFILKNESNQEIKAFNFTSGLSISSYSTDGDSFNGKLFISNNLASFGNANFPPDTPVKCHIKLFDVPSSITSFSLIRMVFMEGYKIEFKNISL